MLSHYYTLLHLSREIGRTLVGKVITEIYTQEKNQLRLVAGGEPALTLVSSCEPTENFLYLREGYTRARRNSADLLAGAIEGEVVALRIAPEDREIIMELRSGRRLRFQLFGSRANVLLTGESDGGEQIVDAFLRRKETTGLPYHPEERRPHQLELLRRDEEAFLSAVHDGGPSAIQAVKGALPALGSLLAREVFLRANVDPSAEVLLTTDREFRRVHAEAVGVIGELSSDRIHPRIYSRGDVPVAFSLIPLRLFADEQCEEFNNISVALQRYVSRLRASGAFRSEKESLLRWLEGEERKVVKALGKMGELETGRGPEYERKGKLIMLHLHELRKGLKSASLSDPVVPAGKPEAVPLDPALTPVQNAEHYFAKAKKAHTAEEEDAKRRRELRSRQSGLAALRSEVEEIHSHELLERFRRAHASFPGNAGPAGRGKQDLPPFRLFRVEGGFEVLAGKSSENNDLLTMKYARPDDLWFHCRGSSGSHVILRVNTGKGAPSKGAIMAAASIAAYYSKMKKATMVPVAMTEKKYVRKPKRAPAGTVVIEREKVLFAEPKLPDEEGGSVSP